MNQQSRVPDPRASILRRTAPGLVGALVLGSILVAACGPGTVASGVPGSSASPTTSAPASPTIAAALQNDFVKVVGSVSPSVVVIETASGLGSGVVFDTNGDIVTNDHVVAGSTTFSVTLAGGAVLPGTLVGTYPAGDLAVIHV
ncbi:MAG: putative serine protease PepD, partial [Chloroflexota bacterium]|nr:putative serine protease PepD [Chloroflexota bacterium]